MKPLHMPTSSLAHSFWRKCSNCLRFEGCSIGFRSGLIEANFRIVVFWFLAVLGCFLLCVLGHYPVLVPMTCDSFLSLLQNSLIVLRFCCALHRFKTSSGRRSKAVPKHTWATFMFCNRYSVLFFESFKHRADDTGCFVFCLFIVSWLHR